MEPEISVIIPTRDRPGPLERCLDGLVALTAPPTFEVIVVDDGSRQPIDRACERARDRVPLQRLRQGWAGPAAARNAGASRARGRLLAFLDDDCLPAPGWLANLTRRCQERPGALVGGRTLCSDHASSYGRASQALLDIVYARQNLDPDDARFFASNNLAVEADRFRSAGGFDPEFRVSEDREFCLRWRRLGRPIVHEPRAVVFHERPGGLLAFWGQHFAYGRGARRFHALANAGGDASPDVGLVATLASRFLHGAWSVAALGLVSQVASAAGYSWDALTRPRE